MATASQVASYEAACYEEFGVPDAHLVKISDAPCAPGPHDIGGNSPAASPDLGLEPISVSNQEDFAEFMKQCIEDIGAENEAGKCLVYLITVARVLAETMNTTDLADVKSFSKEDILKKVTDAIENTERPGKLGGRMRQKAKEGEKLLELIVVFSETHATGEMHFHIVVKLRRTMRFLPFKRALRQRHRLASHWSCNHAQLYSALRYCSTPSARKPVVDVKPLCDPPNLDVFALSQEPWQAKAWKRRREENDQKASSFSSSSSPSPSSSSWSSSLSVVHCPSSSVVRPSVRQLIRSARPPVRPFVRSSVRPVSWSPLSPSSLSKGNGWGA